MLAPHELANRAPRIADRARQGQLAAAFEHIAQHHHAETGAAEQEAESTQCQENCIIIGHEVARAVGVRAMFAERRDGRLWLRRGFQIASGERVLVVEDVVTTGGSTRETIAVVQEAGGHVVGAAAIINRAGTSLDFGVPFEALAAVAWPTHARAECPMCAARAPLPHAP